MTRDVPALRAANAVLRMASAGDVEGVPGEHGTAQEREWRHPVTGELHRLNGPAVSKEHFEAWYVNGVQHRDGGPAVTQARMREWRRHGARHRLDGPAVEHVNPDPGPTQEWWVRGHKVNDVRDCWELERLFEAGDVAVLELVLTAWRPGGPSIVELSAAIAAARS